MHREHDAPNSSVRRIQAGRVATASLSGAAFEAVRKWGPAAAYSIILYFAWLWLPFQFPPRQFLVSPSYTFGFNNGVAVLAMATLLGVATMYCLLLGGSRRCDPHLNFDEGGAEKTLLSRWLFLAVAVAYALATAGL